MSNPIEIPTLLKGSWDHLLILTYGADLAFFENALWRQLSNRCKNKIILADGRCYLQAFQDAERNGTVRYVNQNYVFDGIFTPFAAHSKLILLTNSEEGRLLVGSGNLNMQGYASGGELFTHYEYSKKSPESLAAFTAIRAFLERLIEKNALRPITTKHINHLFETTPWLYHASDTNQQSICHNLDESMIEQLKRAVGKELVDELWVLSPFYDPEAKALERLIYELSPKDVHLLLQPGLTSANPKALRRVAGHDHSQVFLHPFSLIGDLSDVYVHAKLYLVKTTKRVICLQGSPNLSQVAMMRPFKEGNLELANLLIYPANDKHVTVLDALKIHSATKDLNLLKLEYREEERPPIDLSKFLLRGGDWDGKQITLHFSGKLPDLHSLTIGDVEIPSKIIETGDGFIRLELPTEYHELLDENRALNLVLGNKEKFLSNPIYLLHRKKLGSLLNLATSDVPWTTVGDLNLGDEELENLLIDLDANLLIDRQSIWRVAKKEIPPITDEDDEALRFDYADIDYEQLRRHPKLQQYRHSRTGGFGAVDDQSPLQALLSSILDHFRDISDISYGRKGLTGPKKIYVSEEATQDEAESLDDQRALRLRQSATQRRVRRILKSFIRRYLKGLHSADFQELVGPEILIKNYTIFSHILWRLFHRDELEPEFIAERLLEIWRLFWGSNHKDGIFNRLDTELQSQALKFIHEHKCDAQMLASIYYSSIILMTPDTQSLVIQLRNVLRRMLNQDWFPRTTETLEATWVYLGNLLLYAPPPPTRIIRSLITLASYETIDGLMDSLEKEFGLSRNGCRLESQIVYRQVLRKEVAVDTLVIQDANLQFTAELAKKIMQRWQTIQEKDYYRIVTANKQCIFQYETKQKQGSFYFKPEDVFEEFGELTVNSPHIWKSNLEDLLIVAQILEKQLSLTTSKRTMSTELK